MKTISSIVFHTMKIIFSLLSLILICACADYSKAESLMLKSIRLAAIDGRDLRMNSHGKPFFAHVITHASNNRNAFNFIDFLPPVSDTVSKSISH